MKEIKTTPKGTAIYPHLRKPETYEGSEIGFTVKLALEPKAMEDFKNELYLELEKASGLPEFAGKSFKGANLPLGELQDGQEVIKFKTKASGVSRTGQPYTRTVPMFDAKGKPLPLNKDIGYGSIIKVAYSIRPYWKNRNMRGLSLMIEGVQVLEMIEPGSRNSKFYGFGEEEGYECKDEQVDNQEDIAVPFGDDGADF